MRDRFIMKSPDGKKKLSIFHCQGGDVLVSDNVNLRLNEECAYGDVRSVLSPSASSRQFINYQATVLLLSRSFCIFIPNLI